MDSKDIYRFMVKKCPNTRKNKHYLKRYVRFIVACLEKNEHLPEDTYTEKHHILPQSKNFWPEYKRFGHFPWNLAKLTPRQHFIAHTLLAKSFGGLMWYAIKFMMNNQHKQFFDSRLYEKAKEYESKKSSERLKTLWENDRDSLMEKMDASWTDERKQIHSINMLNAWDDQERRLYYSLRFSGENNPMYNQTHSKEAKDKIRNSRLGKPRGPLSEETKNKMSISSKLRESNKTKEEKEEISKKIKAACKRRVSKECPHCNKICSPSNAARWHFDNCKYA